MIWPARTRVVLHADQYYYKYICIDMDLAAQRHMQLTMDYGIQYEHIEHVRHSA